MHTQQIGTTGRLASQKSRKSNAVGLVRTDVSGPHAPRHATEIRRHAEGLGYHYLYTVRPPEREVDPVGYALAIAVGVHADALVVHDLTTVDNTPARFCETCDLETVCPAVTWTRARPGAIGPGHAHPDHPLTVPEAHRVMQQHRGCRAATCPRKASALSCLVRAGKLVPPVSSPRERAAARGLAFDPPAGPLPVSPGPDLELLLHVLDALSASIADSRSPASRLSGVTRTERD
ncbi:hypothetical protein LTT66_22385 [Nocardia gipuzkoensis]|uniref:hypothetical protein n=1 Tax=Nocardia gipuzkoensis TaxID=2749991 RepID=UPI001E6212BE|nr:hypothetical protein [Nocardia gipuzkoensis]UGT66052.1 hypothetical protein LTT66_22385 [Nocardia gipuzkoensis]